MERGTDLGQQRQQQQQQPAPSTVKSQEQQHVIQQKLLDRARHLWLYQRAEAVDQPHDQGGVGAITSSSMDADAERYDISDVEVIYRSIWNGRTATAPTTTTIHGSEITSATSHDKQISPTSDSSEVRTPEECTAGERLALVLLQKSPSSSCDEGAGTAAAAAVAKADAILHELRYTCRLAHHIFHSRHYYDEQNTTHPKAATAIPEKALLSSSSLLSSRPCLAWDDFLPAEELYCLQTALVDPTASYYVDHNYAVEPIPSPYVSYCIPLPTQLMSNANNTDDDAFVHRYGCLGQVILRVWHQIKLQAMSPDATPWLKATTTAAAAASTAKTSVATTPIACEIWMHNRPIGTGHQLHYDSDNEGCDSVIRHPLLTAILCLHSPNSDDSSYGSGGPTLVTNQRLASRVPASKGYLVHPKTNRLVLMDGRVLHCVVPGKPTLKSQNGPSSAFLSSMAGNIPQPPTSAHQHDINRRVTLMMAFWKRIRIRNEDTPGAARPFPLPHEPTVLHPTCPKWAHELIQQPESSDSSFVSGTRFSSVDSSTSTATSNTIATCGIPVEPMTLSHVFERVTDGQPWKSTGGTMVMPTYDQVFQGI